MSVKLTLLAAVAGLSIATSANALVVVSSPSDMPLPVGQALVYDFDGYVASGYTLTLGGAVGVFDGSAGLVSGVAAPPPGTVSDYLAIQAGGSATLDTPLIRALSVYIGSPDSYNSIRFIGLNGFDVTLSGAALADGSFGGNQSIGRRMTYDFGADRVTQVIFSSSGNSFELDNIAVTSAVPEPATWAMMITGFGMLGATLRRRRATALQPA